MSAPDPAAIQAAIQAMEEPDTFGRYVLHHLLGEGGMAEVHLAEQQGSEGFSKLVALKRMLPHLCKQTEFVTMFLDEVRLAARLSHPNIVQVFDFGEIDGRYFAAMEYLAGEDLGTIMSQAAGLKRPVPVPVAIQLIAAVCEGLHHAHEYSEGGKPLNIVHRDVSPSNVVVTYQGGVKLVDFGIARARDRRSEQTETGVVKGKFPYCSPEQLRCTELDRRSDLFSLAIVAHELLVGRRLFRRETEVSTCLAVLNEPAPAPSSLRSDIPAALDRVILKALSKDPAQRFQTCHEMRKALEALMAGPPVRLDEYLADLFGADRLAARTKPQTITNGRSPTGVVSARRTYDGVAVKPPAPAQAAAAPAPAPVREGETAAVPVDSNLLRSTSRPARRKPALIAGGIGVALLAAAGLFLATRPEAPPPPPPPKVVATAALEIDTLPRGASLELGTRALEQRSPATIKELTAGEYALRATLPGHKPAVQVVALREGESRSIVLTLVQEEARLELEAPAGARVAINGVDRGTARSFGLMPGEYAVRISLDARTADATVQLGPGEVKRLPLDLPEPARPEPKKARLADGKLDVACEPWCRVHLDGRDVGRTSPIVGLPVPAGKHTLKLEHPPTGRSREVVITMKPNGRLRESASFR